MISFAFLLTLCLCLEVRPNLAAPHSSWRVSAPRPGRRTCSAPAQRADWATFTASEKYDYFTAVNCLMTTPSVLTTIPDAVSLYDDLVGTHQLQSNVPGGTDLWHVTGQFLHVHRLFLHTYETLLRNDCSYSGKMPYWNEVADSGAFSSAEILRDYGGSGLSSTGQVTTGPFANHTCNLGPGATNTPHILYRNVSDVTSLWANATYVGAANAETTLAGFRSILSDKPHSAGHGGVGGDMINYLTSVNDPLFFMHHTYLDKVWWEWQQVDPATRTYDIAGAGYETQAEPATGYVNTSLSTVLNMYGLIANGTVNDVCDTQGALLCYIYV